MAILIFIGSAQKFVTEAEDFFKSEYKTCIMNDDFKQIRSALSATKDETLYLIPNLSKPERYEIFCLARKNEQFFISIVDQENDESCSSDKNIVSISSFNGEELKKKLFSQKIAPTTANKRSKGVSLKNVGELKALFNQINIDFAAIPGIELVFKDCEERVIKIWNFNPKYSLEDAKQCYKTLVETELKNRK